MFSTSPKSPAQVSSSPAEPFKLPASEIPTYLPWTKTCWQAQDKKTCGTRSGPTLGAYVSCVASGCEADYTVSYEMIGRMKNRRYLIVQAIHVRGKPINWMVPVADFRQAYDGPSVGLEKILVDLRKSSEV